MREKEGLRTALLGGLVLLVSSCGASMNENGTNERGPANTNMATPMATPRAEATPAGRGEYSEEQARQERDKAKANKETIGQSLDDAWIHTKLVAKLIGDSKTPERSINVDVVQGAVTLRGTVETAEAKTEAERVARETEGVTKVTNELKVALNKSGNTNKNDNKGKNKSVY